MKQMSRRLGIKNESLLTRAVNGVFGLMKVMEFEILFVLFFLTALISHQGLNEYSQIFVKKPAANSLWGF